jgi:hypothetical protein
VTWAASGVEDERRDPNTTLSPAVLILCEDLSAKYWKQEPHYSCFFADGDV